MTVDSVEQGMPLVSEARAWLVSQGLRELEGFPIDLKVEQLDDWQGGGAEQGFYETAVKRVYITKGLSPVKFSAIACHELVHVWTFIVNFSHSRCSSFWCATPDWAEEGLCELLAYRYLKSLGTEEAEILAAMRIGGSYKGDEYRGAYVKGLQWAILKADGLGLEYFLDVIRNDIKERTCHWWRNKSKTRAGIERAIAKEREEMAPMRAMVAAIVDELL